jgi:uncharacterized protein (TIGR00661 family)
MAKIFYSMAGEGRGHAARVRAVVEQLRQEHQFVLFAPDQAYEFLSPRYPAGFPNVEVRRIPGLRFHYTRGRMDLMKSLWAGAGYLWKLPRLVHQLQQALREERPDLVLADFEPALPRAAGRTGVPFVSLNHQHFLVACDLSSLPAHLRRWAALMKIAVHAHHTHQAQTIVSSFFQAPLRKKYRHVVQVGPLLRPELKSLTPLSGDFILSYLRPNTPPHVLTALAATGREVRVYGLGERRCEGNLRFLPLNERTFSEDLAQCEALVGAAGNQSLGEALYLGKPVLALPEGDHHEQLINAHFLKQMGCGDWVAAEEAQTAHVARFLAELPSYQAGAQTWRGTIDGTAAAIAEIRRFVPLH